MLRRARPLLAIAAMALLAGCGSAAAAGASGSAGQSATARAQVPGAPGGVDGPSPTAGRPPIAVVASTNVWGGIAATIGGSRVTVEAFISQQAQDPHSYEPNPRAQLALQRAGLIIENGGGYDDFMQTMIAAAQPTAPVINAVDASGIATRPAGAPNEHIWYDFPAVGAVASAIAQKLTAIDPADAGMFQHNLATLQGQLAGLGRDVEAIRAAHAGEPVAITESVPMYLLDAAGLVNLTPAAFSHAVEEGSDVPARVLADTMSLMTGNRVKALVYNAQTSGPQTDQLVQAAKAHGIPAVAVTETRPGEMDYVAWMRSVVTALSAALGG